MSTTTPTPTANSTKSRRSFQFDWRNFVRQYLIIIILIALVAILALATDGKFVQPRNLVNVVRQVSAIGIIAIGMTFVIITTGIDLSVGSVVAMAAVVSASLAQLPTAPNLMYPGLSLPAIAAVLGGLVVGALAGGINGLLVTRFRIAPFIATLGMMTAGRGLANIYTGGRPVSTLQPAYNWLGQGSIAGIPVPVVVLVVVGVIAHIMLNYMRFGRSVFAIGGNLQAARVSGININRMLMGVYVLVGVLAALAGMILSARTGSGNPTLGTGIELDAIASTVIGGTAFTGGIGTIWGAIVGALIIGSINTGLDLLNVSPFMQQVVKGVIIVGAIIIDERKNRHR